MKKMKKLVSFLLILAMVMAMVPAVLADGEVTSVELNESQKSLMVGDTLDLTATVSPAEATNKAVLWSSDNSDVATVSDGTVTAVGVGTTTITVKTVDGEHTAACTVTVEKKEIAAPNVSGISVVVAKDSAMPALTSALTEKLNAELGDSTKYFDVSDWELPTGFSTASVTETSVFATAELTLKDATNYKLSGEAEKVSVTASVSVVAAPEISKVEVATPNPNKFIYEAASDTIVTLSASVFQKDVTSAVTPDKMQWYKDSTPISGATDATYAVPKSDFANAESAEYSCRAIIKDSNGIESTEKSSNAVTIQVKKKYTATVTLSNTTVKPQNSIALPVPTVKENKVEGNEFKQTVLSANDFTYTYSISSTAFAAVTGNVFEAKNVGMSAGTLSQKVTVTLNVKSKGTTPADLCTATADITITAPKTEDIAIFENTEFSDWEIAYAVSTALHGASGYYSYYGETQKVSFSATNGKLYNNQFTSGVTSITSAIPDSWVTTTGENTVNSTYFIRNSNATNAYVKFYAFDKDGIIAYGELKPAENKTVNYAVSSSENVVFDEDDFLKFFREVTGSTSATLSYVRFSPEKYSIRNISGTGKYGALYDGTGYAASYVKSTDTFYYNATALQDDLDAVTYYADSTSAKYVVYIPFTATGKVGLSDRTVSGMVAISVNNESVLTMLGTTFKAAGIKNEILAENSTISSAIAYVTFSAPADAGKLYYNYSSIVTGANTPVSALDKFYFSGTGSTKLVDNVYFVPAAGCKDTVSIAYTLYNTSNKSIATGTISFRVTKKTASGIFNDITASNTGSWSADAIDFLATNGVIKGTDSRTFTATANMKRCDFVVMMYRLAGEPSVRNYSNPFTDIKTTDYYYDAVLWAYAKNVVTGNSKTTFNPQGNITREQIAAILYRYAQSNGYNVKVNSNTNFLSFNDYWNISDYAKSAMMWAIDRGIINGSGYNLNPTKNATRAEVAAMLHRFVTK